MTSINTSSIYRITGLASGLDIDQMVSDLMKAQRAPLDKLVQTRQIWQWKQEDYRSINTSLLNLRNIAFNLKLQSSFRVKKAVSSDESIVTATAAGSAVPTTYQVKVRQLATVATNASTEAIANNSFDPSQPLVSQQSNFTNNDFGWDPTTHEFSFTINGQTFSFDGDTASLNSIIAAVNANKEAGVSMFYDPSTKKVGIATLKTGDNNPNGKEIQTNGAFLTNVLYINMENEQGGIDAEFDINGLTGITSHTNSYTVNGVTLNFKSANPNATVTVTVSNDIDTVVNTIKDFVNKYNETLAAVNAKLKEERYHDYLPLTDEQIQEGKLTDKQIDQWQEKARSGLLKGDPLLSSAVSSIRSAMASIVEGLTGQVTVTSGSKTVSAVANSLSVIGITTGTWEEEGKLYLDENRLREALQSNPDAVMELFTRTKDAAGNTITDTKQKGIAVQLYDAINNAISRITSQAGSAGSLYDQSYISRTIRGLNGQISDMEKRLQDLEDRYYRQFTAMEEAIAQMNTQSLWLSQQLSGGGGK